MYEESEPNSGKDGPFCGRLRNAIDDAKNGCKPNEEFFENDLYLRKVEKIIGAHRQKHEDAEELRNDVHLRIIIGLAKFEPDYDLEFGGFFAWVRRIARNRLADIFRSLPVRTESVDDHADDLPDKGIDLDAAVQQSELLKELNRCLKLMTTRERLAFTCIEVLRLPSRMAAVILTAAGFPCSHATALAWAGDALKRYFSSGTPSINELERKGSKSARSRAGSKKAPPKKQAAKS